MENFPSPVFEIEDIDDRKNYCFWKKDNTVVLVDTTRTFKALKDYKESRIINIFGPESFPFQCESAEEYFNKMHDKSLNTSGRFAFIAWVDPETGEAIEPENLDTNK